MKDPIAQLDCEICLWCFGTKSELDVHNYLEHLIINDVRQSTIVQDVRVITHGWIKLWNSFSLARFDISPGHNHWYCYRVVKTYLIRCLFSSACRELEGIGCWEVACGSITWF